MQQKRGRIESIDMMRGLCLLAMAVDHVRDHLIRLEHTFFGAGAALPLHPTDIANAHSAVFWLRCISHIFAPPFLFLAGTGAFLWQQRHRDSTHSLFRYLFLRGAMLALFNGLLFSHAPFSAGGSVTLHVLWPIGISMMFLGIVARWPTPLLWCMAGGFIIGQNIFETIAFQSPLLETLWILGFKNGLLHLPWGAVVDALWPVMPWFGVMLLGYLCGNLFLKGPEKIRILLILGTASLGLFIFLRATGLYGDSNPWVLYDEAIKSAGAFINVTKYPPSFQFFLYGFGSMCLIMAVMEKYAITNRMILAIGCAPLFYYFVHVLCLRTAKFIMLHIPPSLWEPYKSIIFSTGGILVGGALLALFLWPLCELYTNMMRKRSAKRRSQAVDLTGK